MKHSYEFIIKTISANLLLKDDKGNNIDTIEVNLTSSEQVEVLLLSFTKNTEFKGSLIISSEQWNDNICILIANLINVSKISKLIINNKCHPFSDKVSSLFARYLITNTYLRSLNIYLNIGKYSSHLITELLSNSNSNLTELGYLKISNELLHHFSKNSTKLSNLKKIIFYFEPLKVEDPLKSNLFY